MQEIHIYYVHEQNSDHQQKYTTEQHKLTSNDGKLPLYSKMITMNNMGLVVLVVIKFIGNTMVEFNNEYLNYYQHFKFTHVVIITVAITIAILN